MTPPAYPSYRKSQIEWLDKVPSHWANVPIKYMALEKKSLFLDGDWIESKDISGDEIRYITTGNIGEGCYKEQGTGFITKEKFSQLDCTEVFEGDILISRLNAPIGRSCIIPNLFSRIVTSVDNVIFRCDEKYHKQFIVHLFSSKDYFKHTSNLARGATMQRISRGLLGNIRVVVPPYTEQQKIANFLDHETAKIDTLIEKQQQLIKLLKEKRQAVISHAVTKGLNPDVPMRDSGVEWLGDVPEHWVVKRVKHFGRITAGYAFKSGDFTSAGVKAVKIANVSHLKFDWSDTSYLPNSFLDTQQDYIVPQGSLVFAMTRPIISGGVKVAKFELDEACLVNQRVGFLKPSVKINQNYLMYVAQSKSFFCAFENNCTVTNQPNISAEGIEDIRFACPDLLEQQNIVDYIKRVSDLIGDSINKGQHQIELLQERRTALISAAVTGKIDVRNWQAP